jgi:L-alanine-DL-glutamate epimerase-like enolase superfamily enzyme
VEKITEIEVLPVGLPRKESIALRYGSVSTLDNAFVAIRTEGGIVGYGESAPIPPTFGETQATVVEVLRNLLAPKLIGQDALNINQILASLEEVPGFFCAKSHWISLSMTSKARRSG